MDSIISAEACKYLKPVLMELGGKANAIVMADAGLDKAATHCAVGAFIDVSLTFSNPCTRPGCRLKPGALTITQAGQICMSTEDILVHENVADKFAAVLKTNVQQIFGSLGDTPILISESAAARNRARVEIAVSRGAAKVDLFSVTDKNSVETGHEAIPIHMRPIVLTGIDQSMDLYGEESFGPQCVIIYIPR